MEGKRGPALVSSIPVGTERIRQSYRHFFTHAWRLTNVPKLLGILWLEETQKVIYRNGVHGEHYKTWNFELNELKRREQKVAINMALDANCKTGSYTIKIGFLLTRSFLFRVNVDTISSYKIVIIIVDLHVFVQKLTERLQRSISYQYSPTTTTK